MTGRRLRALLVALVPVLVLAPGFAAPVAARTPDSGIGPASRTVLTLDGVRVALPAGSDQVVTVNHTVHSRSRVTLWQRDSGSWRVLTRSRRWHPERGRRPGEPRSRRRLPDPVLVHKGADPYN